MPADHLVQQRGVEDGAGDRPRLVEAAGHRHDAVAGDTAVRRLDADGPGKRAGLPDRAAGVGADGDRRQPGGHGGGRATAGATGRALGVPRVAARAVRRVLGRRAHGELIEVGLAEDRHAGGAEAGDDGRVVRRHPTLEDPRPAGGGLPDGAEQVLDRDGHTGQRGQLGAGGPAGVDVEGGRHRTVVVDVEEGVQVAVEVVDASEEGAGDVRGGRVALGEGVRQLDGGERGQVRHVTPPPGSSAPGTAVPRWPEPRRAPARG